MTVVSFSICAFSIYPIKQTLESYPHISGVSIITIKLLLKLLKIALTKCCASDSILNLDFPQLSLSKVPGQLYNNFGKEGNFFSNQCVFFSSANIVLFSIK